jgi:hypothetical protein
MDLEFKFFDSFKNPLLILLHLQLHSVNRRKFHIRNCSLKKAALALRHNVSTVTLAVRYVGHFGAGLPLSTSRIESIASKLLIAKARPLEFGCRVFGMIGALTLAGGFSV